RAQERSQVGTPRARMLPAPSTGASEHGRDPSPDRLDHRVAASTVGVRQRFVPFPAIWRAHPGALAGTTGGETAAAAACRRETGEQVPTPGRPGTSPAPMLAIPRPRGNVDGFRSPVPARPRPGESVGGG